MLLAGNLEESVATALVAQSAEILERPDEATEEGLHIWHFPFGSDPLDNLIDVAGIASLARRLLNAEHVLLNSCMLWVRLSDDSEDLDTSFHRDYTDNGLVARRGITDALGFIIYLTDIDLEDGPTRYLPRSVGQNLPLYPRRVVLNDGEYLALDRHAVPIVGPAGSVLVHSLLGVHRACRPTRPGRRVTLHAVFRRADAHWMGWSAWPRMADSDRFRASFSRLTPTMRELLGWPADSWDGWRESEATRISSMRFGYLPAGRDDATIVPSA